jgi:monothiol glutaredoxin
MALTEDTKAQIEQLIAKNDVVLFMKGNKHFPQCGFSARVIKILNDTGVKYDTVNVLADGNIRDGIKEFSEWPTIPQLYVRKEFVGGCDIVTEMHSNGELQKLFGVTEKVVPVPSIKLSKEAAKTIIAAQEGDDRLRLEISDSFQYDLFFAPPKAGDLIAVSEGVYVHFDKASASRANGVSIDYIEAKSGAAFKIENPNEPPRVKPLSVNELKTLLDTKAAFTLVDVRTSGERDTAKIEGALFLDDAGAGKLGLMPKDTKLVFQCHHGMRSRATAERYLKEGFTNVYNLEGGIDAWSVDIDSSVPRY